MSYTYVDLAKDVLRQAETMLTVSEIWERAGQEGLVQKLKDDGKTPALRTLSGTLTIETCRKQETTVFSRTEGASKFYFLKSRESELKPRKIKSVEEKSISKKTDGWKEKNLHPLLAYFAYSNIDLMGERNVYTKTIRHTKGAPTGYSQWLHPDMVGVYFPFNELEKDVIELSGAFNANKIFRLFSFELKREITRGTYRECYFQAVSNSSWAHEGYLVAAKITDDTDLRNELERLNKAFGIGVIHLNLQNISESSVLFRAAQRPELDWETINKLRVVNDDFKNFVGRVNIDVNAQRVHISEYDDILPDASKYIFENFGIKTVE